MSTHPTDDATLDPLPLPDGFAAWVEDESDADTPMPAVELADLHRYARARAAVARRMADVDTIHARTVAQADAWRSAARKPLEREALRLDLALAALLAQHRERNPRSKTLECGWGVTVRQRRKAARFVQLEQGAAADAALLLWLQEHGGDRFVRVKKEPAWGDLAAHGLAAGDEAAVLVETGERLPDELGVRFQPSAEGEPEVSVALEGGEQVGG